MINNRNLFWFRRRRNRPDDTIDYISEVTDWLTSLEIHYTLHRWYNPVVMEMNLQIELFDEVAATMLLVRWQSVFEILED